MASASSLAHFKSADAEKGLETIEMDPQYAVGLGLTQGDIVRDLFVSAVELCLTARIRLYYKLPSGRNWTVARLTSCEISRNRTDIRRRLGNHRQ
jgi:hypothetical protein